MLFISNNDDIAAAVVLNWSDFDPIAFHDKSKLSSLLLLFSASANEIAPVCLIEFHAKLNSVRLSLLRLFANNDINNNNNNNYNNN